jgi:hypothetical protein
MLAPELIADAGAHTSLRFPDFFTAKNVAPLAAVRTYHVSAYVEVLGRRYRSADRQAAPSRVHSPQVANMPTAAAAMTAVASQPRLFSHGLRVN